MTITSRNTLPVPVTPEPSTRMQIAALVFSMTNAVLFGVGLIVVLMLPPLNANAGLWIAIVVAWSLILSAAFAWLLAPRLRARYWRRHAADPLHLS